jgi:hypothetical protein
MTPETLATYLVIASKMIHTGSEIIHSIINKVNLTLEQVMKARVAVVV